MSLRVWLPLNGNLNNQGLDGSVVTNVGATVNNNGKIGKCYSFNGSNNTMTVYNPLSVSTPNFSICAWVKFNSISANGTIYSARTVTGSGISIFLLGGSGQLRFDDGSIMTTFGDYSLTANVWTHVCVTRDSSSKKLYINGELKQSVSSVGNLTNIYDGQGSIGASSLSGTGFGNYTNGYMNDFRIYDHTLSLKEIREIAKGLVVHYKLSGNGNNNLAKNTNVNSTSYFSLAEQTGGSTRSVVYEDGVPCVKVVRNTTEHGGWAYISHTTLDYDAIKVNTDYTVSLDIKASVSGTMSFTGLLNGNATNYMTTGPTVVKGGFVANEWCHLVFRAKTIASFANITVGGQCIYLSSSSLLGTGVQFMVKNVKLEEGTKDTPWKPHSSDARYGVYGYGDIEHDCSGYGYDAIRTVGSVYSADTPRYESSYYFNADRLVNLTTTSAFLNSGFSIACWVKRSTGTTIYAFGAGTAAAVLEQGSYFIYNTAGSPYVGNWTSSLNTWMHTVLVHDGTTLKLYVNGAVVGTVNTGFLPLYDNTYLNIGGRSNGAQFGGYLSDFRIYVTPLSATDVQELYSNASTVDSDENMYSYAFMEE